ncbi:Gfo/Idh/MocA family protein [Desulfobaculum bizertense]|uniref:Predicted dehydrogenase n=1 Tax=Desulfobaculum bizertense DSM 18034 TaxID=1121442 RepID=A0A1T4VFF5_9BACT|nr:Gfo/Idh/MocA family oxidoreductase [Desulfobaculum bizertense]UIJ37730.1 Gfo/Idh/MocA family oxidoreductase [Desulfobaculum bizertense]SKA63715.1 Predicted dehydrogenase [Desulfobaculum bizertense DSM 18034]
MNTKTMRVGVIGLGWMGKIHLRVYSELPNVEVVGVMDTNEEVLKEVEEKFNVKTFTDLDSMLEMELDAVSVCVPTVHHLPVGLKVMDKNIPLLIEKPLAASADAGRQLLNKAEEKGLTLMVGHIERFNQAVRRVRELVQDDEVLSINIERVGPYPPRIQDVGVIKDLGSHDIDLIRFITGAEYKDVYAVMSSSRGKHEDSALITAQMDNGILAHISTNWVTPYKSRAISVATKTKYIHADLVTQDVKEYSEFEGYDANYTVREWPVMYKEPVPLELKAFLNAIRTNTEPPITGRDGLTVLETIERVLPPKN